MRSSPWAYGIAILLPAVALSAQSLLGSWVGGVAGPFLLAYPTVLAIGWLGGQRPGVLSTLLCGLAGWYLFLPPRHGFSTPRPADLLQLGVFVLTGVLFSTLVSPSRRGLRRLNHEFLTLLEHTSDFIYFKDKDSRIRFCSKAMANLCGFGDWRELIGKHDFELFPAETARIYFEEELPVFREGKALLDKEDPYIGPKGDRRWVSTNKWPVFGGDGKTVVGIFGISRDITERKRAEEELRRFAAELSEANRLKDVFTDVLRHDILTPVSAIRISTDLLLRIETDAKKIDVLKRVRQSTLNLAEMTEDAARLASLTAGQPLEFSAADPVEALRSVLPDLEHKLTAKNITLVDHSGSGFSASFNAVMKDVFINLISNAIKYSPDGTRVEIGVEDRGESWVLSVKDQGVGVPDEHKQKIFNRFERLGREGVRGSGLGLTITKQIVSLHGGEIWVEDNPSGGSIFLVRLPKTPKAP